MGKERLWVDDEEFAEWRHELAVKRWVGVPDEADFHKRTKRHVRDSKVS